MYSNSKRQVLRERWEGQELRIQAIIDDIKAGKDWTRHLLKSKENGWDELPELDSCPASPLPFAETDKAKRDLRGITLSHEDFSGKDKLVNSHMDFCVLDNVDLSRTSLRDTTLRHADIRATCRFEKASLQYADMYHAKCRGVSFVGADFTNANFEGADFEDAVLLDATFKNVNYNEERWYDFVRFHKWTRFGGEYQSSRQLGKNTSSLIAKYITGENLRWSFKQKHWFLGWIWHVTANYGRSPLRVLFWAVVIWLGFGTIYSGYTLPACFEDTPLEKALCWFSPEIDWDGCSKSACDGFTPYYFSAVTMTSLDYGDISPKLNDCKAQIYVCFEAFLGYMVLGGFIACVIRSLDIL